MIITKNLRFATSNTLLRIGIPYNINGAKYLIRAVEIAVESPDAVMNITKRIYQIIAIESNTKAANIERAIRNASDIAWSKNRIAFLNTIFGVDIYEEQDRPCNGEFIALLAERIPYIADDFDL
jgi:hypothetical protein